MQALQNNLDGKSKQYKDPALTQLFLMNNIHYIVRSVRKYVTLSWHVWLEVLGSTGNTEEEREPKRSFNILSSPI